MQYFVSLMLAVSTTVINCLQRLYYEVCQVDCENLTVL